MLRSYKKLVLSVTKMVLTVYKKKTFLKNTHEKNCVASTSLLKLQQTLPICSKRFLATNKMEDMEDIPANQAPLKSDMIVILLKDNT